MAAKSKQRLQASLGCVHAIIGFFWREQRDSEHKYKARKWKFNLRIHIVSLFIARGTYFGFEGHEVGHVLWVSYFMHRYSPRIQSVALLTGLSFLVPSLSSSFLLVFTHFQDLVQIGRMKVHESLSSASRMLSNDNLRLTLAVSPSLEFDCIGAGSISNRSKTSYWVVRHAPYRIAFKEVHLRPEIKATARNFEGRASKALTKALGVIQSTSQSSLSLSLSLASRSNSFPLARAPLIRATIKAGTSNTRLLDKERRG